MSTQNVRTKCSNEVHTQHPHTIKMNAICCVKMRGILKEREQTWHYLVSIVHILEWGRHVSEFHIHSYPHVRVDQIIREEYVMPLTLPTVSFIITINPRTIWIKSDVNEKVRQETKKAPYAIPQRHLTQANIISKTIWRRLFWELLLLSFYQSFQPSGIEFETRMMHFENCQAIIGMKEKRIWRSMCTCICTQI